MIVIISRDNFKYLNQCLFLSSAFSPLLKKSIKKKESRQNNVEFRYTSRKEQRKPNHEL